MKEKEKRTWHYVEAPSLFGLCCSKCGREDTYWSEFENHIWCYGCEEDIEYTPGYEIFPVGVAMALGVTFDKIDIASGERIIFRRE